MKTLPWAIALGTLPLYAQGSSLDTLAWAIWQNEGQETYFQAQLDGAVGDSLSALQKPNPELRLSPKLNQHFNPSLELELMQTLERPQIRQLRLKKAQIQLRNQSLQKQIQYDLLRLEVQKNVLELHFLDQKIQLQQGQSLWLQKMLRLAEQKNHLLQTSKLELAQLEMKQWEAQQDSIQISHDLNSNKWKLELRSGRKTDLSLLYAETDFWIKQTPLSPEWKASSTVQKKRALENETAQMGIREADLMGQSTWAIGPVMDLSRGENALGFGFALSIPLWNPNKGQMQKARAEMRAVQARQYIHERQNTQQWSLLFQTWQQKQKHCQDMERSFQAKQVPLLQQLESSWQKSKIPLSILLEIQGHAFAMQQKILQCKQELAQLQMHTEEFKMKVENEQ